MDHFGIDPPISGSEETNMIEALVTIVFAVILVEYACELLKAVRGKQ